MVVSTEDSLHTSDSANDQSNQSEYEQKNHYKLSTSKQYDVGQDFTEKINVFSFI